MGRLSGMLICAVALLAASLGAVAEPAPARAGADDPGEALSALGRTMLVAIASTTGADEALGALGYGLALMEARSRIDASRGGRKRPPPAAMTLPGPIVPRRSLDPAARLRRLQRHHDPPPQRRRPGKDLRQRACRRRRIHLDPAHRHRPAAAGRPAGGQGRDQQRQHDHRPPLRLGRRPRLLLLLTATTAPARSASPSSAAA